MEEIKSIEEKHISNDMRYDILDRLNKLEWKLMDIIEQGSSWATSHKYHLNRYMDYEEELKLVRDVKDFIHSNIQ